MKIMKWEIFKRKDRYVFDVFHYEKSGRIDFVKVFCLRHLRFWNEGDNFIEYGGKACRKCCRFKLSKEIR